MYNTPSKMFFGNGRQMNVCSIEEYLEKSDEDKQSIIEGNNTVIEISVHGQNDMYLPIQAVKNTVNLSSVGCYTKPNDPFLHIKEPITKNEKEIYQPEPNSGVIISLRPENMQQYLDEAAQRNGKEKDLLERCESDGRYIPPRLEEDAPEMRALKECIIAKEIDLDKYSERFGVNYPNDKRKLKDPDITSYLLKRFCSNLDIDVDMVFRDKEGDIANPMNKEIRINLVPGNGNNVTIIDK